MKVDGISTTTLAVPRSSILATTPTTAICVCMGLADGVAAPAPRMQTCVPPSAATIRTRWNGGSTLTAGTLPVSVLWAVAARRPARPIALMDGGKTATLERQPSGCRFFVYTNGGLIAGTELCMVDISKNDWNQIKSFIFEFITLSRV